MAKKSEARHAARDGRARHLVRAAGVVPEDLSGTLGAAVVAVGERGA